MHSPNTNNSNWNFVFVLRDTIAAGVLIRSRNVRNQQPYPAPVAWPTHNIECYFYRDIFYLECVGQTLLMSRYTHAFGSLGKIKFHPVLRHINAYKIH